MNKLIEKLVKLLDVKSLMSLVAISIFAVLALNKTIAVDNVMQVILLILTFYFAKADKKEE